MSDAEAKAAPLVTVMVSPREGHSHAETSLRSVLADDTAPFELIYVDILSPPETTAVIDGLVAERGGRIIRHDTWLPPATARKRALGEVRTKYVLFVDNDVLVEAGCFGRLLACAEETGAALVGPLYLEGGDGQPAIVHMAGGVLRRTEGDDGAITLSELRLASRDAAEASGLTRGAVDFVEYHAVLARTDFLRAPDAISDQVLLVHEHVDLALKARAAGLAAWMEPAARVVYLGSAPRRLADLDFYRRRWGLVACEASMAAFGRHWPLADAALFHAGIREFLARRHDRVRLFRPGAEPGPAPMTAETLAQSRLALREQAVRRGYGASDLRAIESGCDFATLIFHGLYRPDGRPFLNHVIGTASALVRRDLRIEVVLAGLLHAAYTHRPDWMEEAEVTRLLASGGALEAIVRALPRAKAQLEAADRGEPPPIGALTILEAQALAVEGANEADMRLAGEYRASGRPPMIAAGGLALLRGVLEAVGVAGLAADAATPAGEIAPAAILGFNGLHASFRLDAAARRLDPVRPRA